MAKGYTELSPVRPSAALEARYSRQLGDLVAEMANSFEYWLKAAYRKEEDKIALDASPAAALRKVIARLSRRWQSRFNDLAKELADGLVRKSAANVDNSLKQSLRKAGFTVKFNPTRAQQGAITASVAENVTLIKSIPQQYLTQVEGSIMRGINQGFGMGQIAKELREHHGVTKRRAAIIARDQTRKATAAFSRVRQLELGITEAIWKHSSAGKNPRKSHQAFNGKLFNIKDGVVLDEKEGVVWPGTAINCRCYSTPVIRGVYGDDGV